MPADVCQPALGIWPSEVYDDNAVDDPNGICGRIAGHLCLRDIAVILSVILDYGGIVAAMHLHEADPGVIVDDLRAVVGRDADLFQLGICGKEGSVLLKFMQETDGEGRIVRIQSLNPRDQNIVIGNGSLLHAPCLVIAQIVVAKVEQNGIEDQKAEEAGDGFAARAAVQELLCEPQTQHKNHDLTVEHEIVHVIVRHDENEILGQREEEEQKGCPEESGTALPPSFAVKGAKGKDQKSDAGNDQQEHQSGINRAHGPHKELVIVTAAIRQKAVRIEEHAIGHGNPLGVAEIPCTERIHSAVGIQLLSGQAKGHPHQEKVQENAGSGADGREDPAPEGALLSTLLPEKDQKLQREHNGKIGLVDSDHECRQHRAGRKCGKGAAGEKCSGKERCTDAGKEQGQHIVGRGKPVGKGPGDNGKGDQNAAQEELQQAMRDLQGADHHPGGEADEENGEQAVEPGEAVIAAAEGQAGQLSEESQGESADNVRGTDIVGAHNVIMVGNAAEHAGRVGTQTENKSGCKTKAKSGEAGGFAGIRENHGTAPCCANDFASRECLPVYYSTFAAKGQARRGGGITMHIGEIMTADSANGVGIRLTLFVSGCLNHCPGCFQPETWDFEYGEPYTDEMETQILRELSKPYYDGLTLLGGDPMELCNQEPLRELLQRIRDELPGKSVWAYTGYIYEKDLRPGGRRYLEGVTDPYLDLIDILVDGPFVEKQKKITLNFRGSSNQRIIDLKATRRTGQIVLSPLNNE